MSLFELLVIFLVAFLLIKPEDLPKIINTIKDLNGTFIKTKREIFSHFSQSEPTNDSAEINDNIDQINFYLEKIASCGKDYEGEYSLDKIKDHYQKLVKKAILQATTENNKSK